MRAERRCESFEGSDLVDRMHEIERVDADELFRFVTEHRLGRGTHILQRARIVDYREEVGRCANECGGPGIGAQLSTSSSVTTAKSMSAAGRARLARDPLYASHPS